MNFETLGDWCKFLEKNFTLDRAIPTLPLIIRLDGNNFSKWTKGLNRPFDENLHQLMVEGTKFLVEETNALMGYTQSDEITLLLYSSDRKSQIYFDGKKQKILTVLLSKFTYFFNEKRKELLPNHNKKAFFDARVYQVPSKHDAVVQFLWRELDATKNSIQMLGRNYFSHKELQNLNTSKIQEKLFTEKNINWNDLDVWKKRGTYVKKVNITKKYSNNELEKLPIKHKARQNPNLEITKNIVTEINLPILSKIENKQEVFFENQQPTIKKD